jgi:hypothetical protein
VVETLGTEDCSAPGKEWTDVALAEREGRPGSDSLRLMPAKSGTDGFSLANIIVRRTTSPSGYLFTGLGLSWAPLKVESGVQARSMLGSRRFRGTGGVTVDDTIGAEACVQVVVREERDVDRANRSLSSRGVNPNSSPATKNLLMAAASWVEEAGLHGLAF